MNDMEKNPHGWPDAYEVRDALGREVDYFGFNRDRDGAASAECALRRAEEKRVEADWFSGLSVGQRKGGWLETARTVRSRALDALRYVELDENGLPRRDQYTTEERDIITDLGAVVGLLDRWQRTGRTPKYPGRSK
ncbi:hypothetical protein ACFWY9_28775 [Amycolatopsis sp. NPDC059027]|uniref:hypothetical protein n=1 Tax=Amycolatopsis sp. NPDC059027 TaxID=3346709 RepID=UPI00366B8E57